MSSKLLQMPDTSEIENKVDDLAASAARAVIETDEDENKGGDLLKMLKVAEKKLEEDRVAITQPINQSLRAINGKYKAVSEKISAAKKSLEKGLVSYKQKKLEAQREAERIEREARETKALEMAEKLEKEKKQEAAEDILSAAQDISRKTEVLARKVTTRSDYGAVTTMVDVWTAEVTDIKKLCLAVAQGQLSESCVQANLPELNKVAKSLKDEMNIPGVVAVNNPRLQSR